MEKIKRWNIIAVMVGIISVLLCIILVMNLDRMFVVPEIALPAGIDQYDLSIISNSRNGTTPGAQVIIEEFLDFGCSFCSSSQKTVERVMLVYGKNVNVIIRHLPHSSQSMHAAEASECARDQGLFWSYHNILLENQIRLSETDLFLHAQTLGVDMDAFRKCMDSREKIAVIESDRKYANEKVVTATPTFIINGWMIKGAKEYSDFKKIIDSELD